MRSITKRGKLEKKGPLNRPQNPLSSSVSSYGSNSGLRTSSASAAGNMKVHSNFLATYIAEGPGLYPPDCNGDISSASQVLIVVNGRVKAFNVPGVNVAAATTTNVSSTAPMASPVLNLDLDAFFANAGLGISAVTDPHVRFDRLSNKWFVIAQDKSHTFQNYICIAVSNTSVLAAGSSFTIYYMQATTNSAVPSEDYFDYPTLGVDKHALYIGGSIFHKTTGVNKGSVFYIVDKSDLIANTLNFTVYQYGTGAGKSGSDGSQGILIPQAVHNDDPNATEGYFIGVDWASYGRLIMKKISDPGGSPSLSADLLINVPTTESPVNQPALGSTGGIDAFDDRLFAAMIMKNKITGVSTLWTAHNIQVNAAGAGSATGGRNGSRWYEIKDMNTIPVLQQSGTLFDASATKPKGFWIPSIAMNGQGHAVMGSSTAAVDRRVQAAVTSRYYSDPAGTLQPYDTVTKITSAYNPSGASNPYRWGDYSQTVVYPKDNMTMWTFQEYTTNSNQWGLRAIQVKAPAPAQNLSISGSPASFCGSNVVVTIIGTGTNNEGFFDPGDDPNGPGFNRLKITCSGSISVSNVSFVSATQLTCELNTLGKTSGTYTLTVTNPDGQFITGTFSLLSCAPLPVNLKNFDAVATGDYTKLSWETTHEFNLRKYILQRSNNGNTFKSIAEIQAKNYMANFYNYIDSTPLNGNNFYRLKMVDTDGTSKYSIIRLVKFNAKSISIASAFPNPAHGKINLSILCQVKQLASFELLDIAGKKILNGQFLLQQGINSKEINLKNCSPGTYFLYIKDRNRQLTESVKLVKLPDNK